MVKDIALHQKMADLCHKYYHVACELYRNRKMAIATSRSSRILLHQDDVKEEALRSKLMESQKEKLAMRACAKRLSTKSWVRTRTDTPAGRIADPTDA
mmetsp:Transcript_51440/g.80389  ORF Transcript_51440/g.80389 Transcript_51440/m.80389 type:complete len:98 (-) Transcript_51440:46-339(-)